jgi:L-lactate dehydrogenase (cytochrome)
MRMMTCIEDMRLLARRRVPRMFFDYADRVRSLTQGRASSTMEPVRELITTLAAGIEASSGISSSSARSRFLSRLLAFFTSPWA